MRRVAALTLILTLAPATARGEPVRVVASVDGGPAVGLDDRIGAAVAARAGAETRLSSRVALGGGVDASVARWWDTGDEMTSDLVGVEVFGQVHVGIGLGYGLRLEPTAGAGLIYLDGDGIDGFVPAYTSSVALVRGWLRGGVRSRVAIGELDAPGGAFEPATELHVFVGWQR